MLDGRFSEDIVSSLMYYVICKLINLTLYFSSYAPALLTKSFLIPKGSPVSLEQRLSHVHQTAEYVRLGLVDGGSSLRHDELLADFVRSPRMYRCLLQDILSNIKLKTLQNNNEVPGFPTNRPFSFS